MDAFVYLLPTWIVLVVAIAVEQRTTEEWPWMMSEDVEFKILSGSFRTYERMQRALDAERPAGWILHEKLDNQRIRLRRPRAASERDGTLGFDPYRSRITGLLPILAIAVFVSLGVIGAAAAIISITS